MALIVGESQDLHVQAVLEQLTRPATMLDASSFAERPVTVTERGLEVDGMLARGRGWLRRLAPSSWAPPVDDVASVASAERSAALSALAAVLHDERIEWLTPVGAVGVAENKPWQYRLAAGVGAPVPEWVVTTDPARAPVEVGWVAKPLGPGGFVTGEEGYVVPTTPFVPDQRQALSRAPFLLQRAVAAAAHARVVTVLDEVFSATLDARGMPLDWRMSPAGHGGFRPVPVPEGVAELALAVAGSGGLGYSAQDWICDTAGAWWFVDLNPAGQWLFLPEPVAGDVTRAIARFLSEAT
jgi:hypothetical protein